MKPALLIALSILIIQAASHSQITSPVVKANFGVDGDMRANYFNGAAQGSGDDWFRMAGAGTGQFVIDTTGAAAMVARYATDMAFRRLPFFRTMRYPGFTVVNNRLLLDAVFIRDYHGDDSTVFASGANKNGDSPADWSCPVSQGIPDKNDILDMMVHVRRAGPNATDSLWMMGGMSLDNTTGNRYFDFEMYQTDIYYDRGTRNFYGYGPDAGHTSWEFDAAGNITKPGDIIFSAEYQSASLTNIEARIWVHRDALSITPVSFDWSGPFDGADNGATYVYAAIMPKASGAYYTGLQCGNATWGGPFGIILQDESFVTSYTARQFVEFSVNLTKLGLDPVTLLGGGGQCGMPFRRILVKTRASASFTAELKDFVGPFDFFLAPRVDALTESPMLCNESVGEIHVTNPVATSIYQWTTTNGNILTDPPTGTSIYVNQPGTYIVTQYLQDGCAPYASDTITIDAIIPCELLSAKLFDLRGRINEDKVQLDWKVSNNQQAAYFDIERSTDGLNFTSLTRVSQKDMPGSIISYLYNDTRLPDGNVIYYRVKMTSVDQSISYSKVISITKTSRNNGISIYPNPVQDVLLIQMSVKHNTPVDVSIYDASGKKVIHQTLLLSPGNSVVSIDGMEKQPRGLYMVNVTAGEQTITKKIIVTR
jgi:hypothetical protein